MNPNDNTKVEPEVIDLDQYRQTEADDADSNKTEETTHTQKTQLTNAGEQTNSNLAEAKTRINIGITQVNYTVKERRNGDQQPLIHVFGRKEDRTAVHVIVRDFEPYFYVPVEEANKARRTDGVVRVGERDTTLRGDDVVKVYTDIPRTVGNIRDKFDRHYEADILFPDRFLIDTDNAAEVDEMGITSGIRIPARKKEDASKNTYIVDHNEIESINIDITPRVHFMDIEVDDRNGFPDADDAEEKVISISAYDSYDEQYIVWLLDETDSFDESAALSDYKFIDTLNADNNDITVYAVGSEAALFRDYQRYLTKTSPDIMTGWNAIDYDFSYIVNRAETLQQRTNKKVDVGKRNFSPIGEVWDSGGWYGPTIKGRVLLDYMTAYEGTKFSELDSKKLEDVGQSELDVGKDSFAGDIGAKWEEDPETMLEYNLRDVELCVALEQQQDIIKFWDETRKFVGCRIEDATTAGDRVDMYVLQRLQQLSVLPSKNEFTDEDAEDFEGGSVMDPKSDIIDMVGTFDLKSLYPMVMRTINASPETKVDPDTYNGDTHVSPNGIHYRKDTDGFVKQMMEDLLTEREQKKKMRGQHEPGTREYEKYDRQQGSIKVTMNSIYGTLGWDRFRLYDHENAAAVTATGRKVIEYTVEYVKQNLDEAIVYGDTDSVLLSLDANKSVKKIIERGKEIERELNNSYDTLAQNKFNADKHYFQMEFETLYSRFLQAGKKKRYAGVAIWKEGKRVNELTITGFETERSDTAEITETAQRKLINMLMDNETDVLEIREYMSGLIEDIKEGKYSAKKIGIPGGINKNIDNYKVERAHVRGAKYANVLLGTNIRKGDKPKRIYLDRVRYQFLTEVDESKFSERERRIYNEFRQKQDVICFETQKKIPSEFEIDYEKMINKVLRGPIERILEATDITWDEIEQQNTQTGLENFM